MARIVLVGEAMHELSQSRDARNWVLGYGGDTLNTAIHLARAGHDTAYLTAIGSDPLSDSLKDDWTAEGLDTALILTHPHRNSGLYAIKTDAAGERSFSYWRDTSAARDMFALPDMAEALAIAEQADMLGFSLVSLAILPPDGRSTLLALARRVRERGGKVAFDGNYRPRLWTHPDDARKARDAAIACTDIGFPTLEDESLLSGESDADAVAVHWIGLGCTEPVVKLGAAGCRLANGAVIEPPERLTPVDTSGAGDAFNAGYLAARLRGLPEAEAAAAGHALAGWTIMRAGAIPARNER